MLVLFVVYEHVPSMPVTVNLPLVPNSSVDFSFSVVPRVWSPSTVLVAGAAFVSSKKSLFDGCSGNDSPASISLHLPSWKRWIGSSEASRIVALTTRPCR